MKKSDGCPACGKLLIEQAREVPSASANSITKRVTCARCGTYDVDYGFVVGDREHQHLEATEKLRLSHAIRRATDDHTRFAEDTLNFRSAKAIAERNLLPDPVEQADLFIDAVARRTALGKPTPAEHHETWTARIGLEGKDQLRMLQEGLAALVGQSGLGPTAPADLKTVQFTLTLEGWRRARELRQQRGPGNQAFVAMWFHEGLLSAFQDGFAPALKDTGYEPYRVDQAAHNNKIDDQIIAEIRRSKLLVVDTTGARANAYFEAGFAMGLKIPVIWCCNSSWTGCSLKAAPDNTEAPKAIMHSWTEALAFDTRQHPFLFWENPPDLRKKLADRIRALGFDARWNATQ